MSRINFLILPSFGIISEIGTLSESHFSYTSLTYHLFQFHQGWLFGISWINDVMLLTGEYFEKFGCGWELVDSKYQYRFCPRLVSDTLSAGSRDGNIALWTLLHVDGYDKFEAECGIYRKTPIDICKAKEVERIRDTYYNPYNQVIILY